VQRVTIIPQLFHQGCTSGARTITPTLRHRGHIRRLRSIIVLRRLLLRTSRSPSSWAPGGLRGGRPEVSGEISADGALTTVVEDPAQRCSSRSTTFLNLTRRNSKLAGTGVEPRFYSQLKVSVQTPRGKTLSAWLYVRDAYECVLPSDQRLVIPVDRQSGGAPDTTSSGESQAVLNL